MLKGSSSTFASSQRRRGGGGEAFTPHTPSRPEGSAEVLAPRCHCKLFIHLAYDAGPFATYALYTVWRASLLGSAASGGVLICSRSDLIITVTAPTVKGKMRKSLNAKRVRETGPGPIAHDGGRPFCVSDCDVRRTRSIDGADLIRRC